MMFEEFEVDDTVNVLIDFTQKVSFVRLLGNVLVPTRMTIKAEVLPSSEATEIDFDIAFAKIRFWFENVVSRTVVFARSNTQALSMFTDDEGRPNIMNTLMITPSEPTDEHMGSLFQAKMSSLTGGSMAFGAVRINSASPSGLVWSYVGDWHEDLPEMDAWFSTKPYYFDKPWWARDDASTIDMITSTNMTKNPTWAMTLDFIEAAIRPHGPVSEDTSAEPHETPDNIVIHGAFRPQVIDGGSDDGA